MKRFSLFLFVTFAFFLVSVDAASSRRMTRNKPDIDATIDRLHRSIETGEAAKRRGTKENEVYVERLETRMRDLADKIDAHNSGRSLLDDEEKDKLVKRKELLQQKIYRAQMSPDLLSIFFFGC